MLRIDISCGQTLVVTFSSQDLCLRYEDGSELYKCQIRGPENLPDYATGPVQWEVGKRPLIRLFHHTTGEARTEILQCEYFKLSSWNIQGTRRLEDVGYVYLTPLPKLDCDECLKTVAMASDGKLFFRRDPSPYPPAFMTDNLAPFAADVLALDVYRETTRNRTSTLEMWLDPGHLSPQHLIRHYDGRSQFWYEVISAFTARVAMEPGRTLPFSRQTMECECSAARHFDYCVLGDGWRLDGLSAPFNEEQTECILNIERPEMDSNILDFWFDPANSPRFPVVGTSGLDLQRNQSQEES